MKVGRASYRRALFVALSLIAFAGGSNAAAEGIDTGGPTASQFVTWTCTDSPCPWGATTDGHAVVWAAGGLNTRLGYTVSAGIYLPGSSANGVTVSVTAGEASIYAGTPGASSHRRLALLKAGKSHLVSGVAAGEVLSVQDDTGFTYTVTGAAPPTTTTTLPPTTTTLPPTTTTTTTTTTTLPPTTTAVPTTTTTQPPPTTTTEPLPPTTTTTEPPTTEPLPPTTTTQPPTTTTQPPTTTTQPPAGPGGSTLVEWVCTDSPCPWGPSTDGHAVVWPSGGSNTRLGYTVSAGIYLPSDSANGLTVTVASGEASVYAGTPGASSHRRLALLKAGKSHLVSGVVAGEVLSVQDDATFTFTLSNGPAPTTSIQPPTTTTQPPTTTTQPSSTTTLPPTTTTQPPGPGATPSQLVEWVCTGSPCPWGPSSDGHAVVWPAGSGATNVRLGYTVSAGIYLPADAVNGATVSVLSGKASVYAGVPGASSHRRLAIVNQGQTYVVSGVSPGEVLSVQDPAAFTHEITLASEPPPSDACTDPLTCDPIDSIRSFWRCDIPTCNSPDWHGGVIAWPEWAAYANNKRVGNMSRSVYSYDGEPLYAYVGSWINGCKITVVEGNALIVEWERGTDAWRSTYLGPGEQYTIDLVGGEDGVLIETPDTPTDFSIKLDNCTPQPVPKP